MPTKDRVENMIARLSLATKERPVSEKEARERLDLYWRALHDLPISDLAIAFDKILKTATFMPTPAEIRKMAELPGAQREYRKMRARHLIALHEMKWREPVADADRVTPEQIAEIKAKLAGQFTSNRGEA